MWLPRRNNLITKRGNKILLVIAHPDDEAMFFSPLLCAARANNCWVSILCLSDGGYDGLGSVRRTELLKSADCYGVSRSRVTVIDHEQLQDGKHNDWPVLLISSIIRGHILCEDTDMVITFDERGVSDHPNHIATYRGVQQFFRDLRETEIKVVGLKLLSTNVMRKFLGFFDIIFSIFISDHILLNYNLFQVFRGMAAHRSQNVWYRILFVLFSRYTYMNTFSSIS